MKGDRRVRQLYGRAVSGTQEKVGHSSTTELEVMLGRRNTHRLALLLRNTSPSLQAPHASAAKVLTVATGSGT